jgi:UDP-N-acetylglucosamine 2-epimerase (non-hydrolysing)
VKGRKKILFVFGTRPEALKLAPLILLMRRDSLFSPRVCVTSQHREMLEQALRLFGIKPHHDLDIMKKDQSLFDVTSKCIKSLEAVLRKESPHMVIVQGDTTSTFVASLAAFYMKIPVGHVEAGLRTEEKYSPFPEEINRRLTTHISDLHFAPTKRAMENLLREGIRRRSIHVTGNTAVDVLLLVKKNIEASKPKRNKLQKHCGFLQGENPLLLVTAHRRESFGEGIKNICKALREIALSRPVEIVYPVHLNPNVKKPVQKILKGLDNVHLVEPLGYESFVYLMTKSHLILTDSGGIQEEAPSLKKPVLVMRSVTERSEAVEAGAAQLVGTKTREITKTTLKILDDKAAYKNMLVSKNPFGDGKASERIMNIIKKTLNKTQ